MNVLTAQRLVLLHRLLNLSSTNIGATCDRRVRCISRGFILLRLLHRQAFFSSERPTKPKPGDPHCIKAGRTNMTRFKNPVGNSGDCVGITNDTCGYHTGMARTVSHSPIPHFLLWGAMSAFGLKRTFRSRCRMSAFRGKVDMLRTPRNVR